MKLIIFFVQGELIVGDQTGAIHMWDLRTDHNEQLVSGKLEQVSSECCSNDQC